jgi:hypothetical protein
MNVLNLLKLNEARRTEREARIGRADTVAKDDACVEAACRRGRCRPSRLS